jgi:hypothetical protein
MRSYRVTDNRFAISKEETSFNAGAAADISLMAAEGDMITIEPKTEDNLAEMNGKEEADLLYENGQTASTSHTFDKARPHHFGAAFFYGFSGQASVEAAGSGYQHTFLPLVGDIDARRSLRTLSIFGRCSDIVDRQFDGAIVDGWTASFAKDAFVKLTMNYKMSGKVTESVRQDSITAADNATSLTLSHGVHGDTDQERLDSIHAARYQHSDGYYAPVVYSAVSSDTSAGVLTIVPPGSSGDDRTYDVTYAYHGGRLTFPALISEKPLRCSAVKLFFGGMWDGTNFLGGRQPICELKSIECGYNNNAMFEFCMGENVPYATRVWRDARTQTLKIDREMRDYLSRKMKENQEYFGAHIIAEGEYYDSPHRYQVEIIYPRLAIKGITESVDGKRLSESLELAVLQDDTHGSIIGRVKTLVPAYTS